MSPAESTDSRSARWRGLIGVAVQRVRNRATDGRINRLTLAIGIVAFAIALLVVITGIGAGLATQSTVYGSGVDYWIVPESSTTLTTVVSVRGPQLGDVHDAHAEIERIDGVAGATPVLVDIVRMRAPASERPEYVLGIGIVPAGGDEEVAGISTAGFTPGDPHYADGSYDGELTGEVILSPAAATILNASAGEALAVGSPVSGEVSYSEFTVTGVSEEGFRTAGGNLPVAVFHLSELQTLTGAAEGDQADQMLVETNAPGVESSLRNVYSDADVVARQGLNPQQVLDSDLPLAITLTALLVGLVIAGLFVATTMSLEIEADRRRLALLAAIGISERGRLLVVAASTLAIALLGGVVGVVLGIGGILLVNLLATTQFGLPAIARPHPLLVVYGLGVALVVGLLATPYPLLIARRTAIREELIR